MTTHPTANGNNQLQDNHSSLGKQDKYAGHKTDKPSNSEGEPLPIEFREFSASIRDLFREIKKLIIFIRNAKNTNAALVILTLLLAIAGFTQAVIYGIQIHPLRRSAEAAKSAADTANRTMKIAYQPRVIIASLGPNVATNPNKSGLKFLEDGRIRMISNISNIGPLTAKNVHYFTFWEIIGKRENAKRLPYIEAKEPFGYPKVILPKSTGSDASSAFFTDRLTQEQIRTVESPGVWTEFSVLITYDDDFGDTHGTEYCDMFIIGGPQDICPWDIRNN